MNEEETNTTEVAAKTGREMRGPIANSSGESTSTPPTGNESGEASEMPPMGEMPEMNCEDEENCEMPEPPEGFDESQMRQGFGGMGTKGEMMQTQETSNGSSLHPAAYLAMGGGSVILAIIIAYACFSGFFRKRPGETFSSLKKFLLCMLVAAVIAVLLATLCYFIPVWVQG